MSPTRLQHGGTHLINAASGLRLDALLGWPPRQWLRARCVLPRMFGLRSSAIDDPAPSPGCTCGWPFFETADALRRSGEIERARDLVAAMIVKGELPAGGGWPIVISRVEVGGRIVDSAVDGAQRAEIMRPATPILSIGPAEAEQVAAVSDRYAPRQRRRASSRERLVAPRPALGRSRSRG